MSYSIGCHRIRTASILSRLLVPVGPGVEIVGERPPTAFRITRLPLDVLVTIAIGGDRVPFPHQPFPDVPALVGYGAEQASEPVRSLDRNADVLSSDFPDQGALHALPVTEPVAVPMFGLLIPFGGVEPSDAHFLPGHPYPVAIGHVRLARDRACGALDTVRGVGLLDE